MKVRHAFIGFLRKAAAFNAGAQVTPTCILWPDKDKQWLNGIASVRQDLPELLSLGEYIAGTGAGPAIWLKCAMANALEEYKLPVDSIPVLYLPGVSRSDLRAIESCPRDLQPLAELQYRGVFWSQGNGRDWTVNAFLTSKRGGLGLDVSNDHATQEALALVMQAGVLMDMDLESIQGRVVNAEWLHSLLAPNPTRDLLMWMNDATATRQQWGNVLWDVFVKRCNADFGLDPVADGVLVAAERLAKGEGKWGAVSELYRDSYGSFPNVFELLNKVQPPQLGLFPEQTLLAGYPQVNEQSESALRYALSACSGMDAGQARAAVLAVEKEHAPRRGWLWARMGRSPLATALAHLAVVAKSSETLPIGQTPADLAESYLKAGWQVDQAALAALECVHAKSDLDAVGAALRSTYLPWLDESARRLQDAAKASGGLPAMNAQQFSDPSPGTCTVFVDGLRFDVAVRLQQLLSSLGGVELAARWTSLPSVTASGKAWCSPVAKHIAGTAEDLEFEPRVLADGKPLSAHNFKKLLAEHGLQALAQHETGDPAGRAWTEAGDLDHYGHEHGLRLARDMEAQLNQVVERIQELCDAGWRHVRVVTDHGWLLMPGGLPKSELAKHQTETRWGRCAVLKDSAHGTPLTFGWDWCSDVQVAYAPGVSNFVAGAEYAHGGISFQECLVPVIQLSSTSASQTLSSVSIKSVTWRGLRCNVVVEGGAPGLRLDIRTKAALASSSLAASPKIIEADKASVAVADDEHMGIAAVLVVLGPDGEVLHKQSTTVGEK